MSEFKVKLKLVIGQSISQLIHKLLSSPLLGLYRFIPFGHFVYYDLQRVQGRRSADFIFDVGGNVGQTVRGLLPYFKDAKILSFEPSSWAYELLRNYAASKPNVETHKIAFGAQTGQLALHVGTGDNSELSTLVDGSGRDDVLDTQELVDVETIDAFSKKNGIERITLLKMDVQGWELEVLAGASEMLRTGKIDFVLSEVDFSESSGDMVPFGKIHQLMILNGYKLVGIYDQFRWGNKHELYFANALYAKSDLIGR